MKKLIIVIIAIGALVEIGSIVHMNQKIDYVQQPAVPVVIEDSKKIKEVREELVEDMLSKLSKDEWGNNKSSGKLRYTNDPHRSDKTKCLRIGGKRDISCDSWGVYQWKIPTAQIFYKKLYGNDISEKDMLIKLLDDEWVDDFTAEVILKNKGAIWHWSSARRHSEYYNTIITAIRILDK